MTDDEPQALPLALEVSQEWIDANRFTIRADARLALPVGSGEPRRPTEAEARERHRIALIEYDRLLRVWAAYDKARVDLAERARGDRLAEQILALHDAEEQSHDHPVCTGCPSDFEEGSPPYPCETVRIVADHLGVTMPYPDDGRPDKPPEYQDPADWTPPKRIIDLLPGVPVRTIADAVRYDRRDFEVNPDA